MAGIDGSATRDLDDLFCRLADPVAATEEVSDADIPALAKMASSHNVSTILYRKIGGARLAALAPELVAEVEGLTAMTLRLESLLPGLRAAFSSRGLDPIIVKGPVFAERLYPDPADRPFTDIDIVASPEDFDAIGGILTDLGLYQHVKDRFDRSEANQEQKWISDADPNLLIELHGDLVHYPGLRRRVRLGHGELMSLGSGSATALFLTAVAHGALGHKFHTLRLVLDVLQAFRALSDDDRDALLDRAKSARLYLETLQSLRLIATLFGDAQAAEMLRTAAGAGALSKACMIAGRDVLSAPDAVSSRVRRHVFRLLQRYAAR